MNKGSDLIILHDTGGEPYYEALVNLFNHGYFKSLVYLESSILFLLARFLVKKKLNKKNILKLWGNLIFRLSMPFVKDKVIVMGMAPYDFRFFFYTLLAYRNRLIYHTSWPYWWSDNVPRKYLFLTPLFKCLVKYCLNNRPIEIVCVSEAAYNTIIKELNSDCLSRITIIPHCINSGVFSGRDISKDAPNRKKQVLYVGRMVPEKGINLIIELIKHSNQDELDFVLVGDGVLLQKLKEELSSYSNVIITGAVRDKKLLSKIYADSDYLLVPSVRTNKWEELFGIVIIEGMSSGLVVLATDHVGPRELIANGVNGFVYADKEDYTRYLNTINTLGEGEIKSIKTQAKEKSSFYDISFVVNKWITLLTKNDF